MNFDLNYISSSWLKIAKIKRAIENCGYFGYFYIFVFVGYFFILLYIFGYFLWLLFLRYKYLGYGYFGYFLNILGVF